MKKYILYICIAIVMLPASGLTQAVKPIDQMTKEDVMALSYDELLEMPFDDVLKLADIVGVSLDELYEVLVNKDVASASKKLESSFEAPLSTTVVSQDEIIKSGARNIEEALRLVPGMIVREKTTGNYDIHIRGNDNIPPDNLFLYSENSMSLVMIDGRPVYNYVHGGSFWESLPVDIVDVDRIEVVRGPASALYGANAATGVINIITKKPDDFKTQFQGTISAGSLGTRIANLGFGQMVNSKIGYRISANYQFMERITDKLWVHAIDSSIDIKDHNEIVDETGYPVFDPGTDYLIEFPEPLTARDKYGVNGYIFYDPTDNIKTKLSLGTQYSYINSSTMGDKPTSISGRNIQSSYADFSAKVYGLSLQGNYNWGVHDIVLANEGFKVDKNIYNVSAEYDFNVLEGLSIRPGVYFQGAIVDDSRHLTAIGNGFINGRKNLSSNAGGLRADYKTGGFRFIAGVRAEKYNVNKDLYLPFQLIGSYNIKDKHLFRANYSRANRSPFLVDSYSNYTWDRSGRKPPEIVQFTGSKDLKLATTDMIEVGYRVKPHKAVQIDLEGFYTKSKDFGYLSPSYVIGNFSLVDSADVALNGTSVVVGRAEIPEAAKNIPEWVEMAYQNIDVESEQIGATANIEFVVTKNLVIKAFGTYQQTKLKNRYPLTTEQIIVGMMGDAGAKMQATPPTELGNKILTEPIPPGTATIGILNYDNSAGPGVTILPYTSMKAYSDTRPDTIVAEQDHKATPSYYGGFSINYTAFDKVNAFVSTYFYGEQEFTNQYGTYNIDPKTIVNLKLSYKLYKENSVFFNARNLFNSKGAEFAFLDETQAVYLFGLDLKF